MINESEHFPHIKSTFVPDFVCPKVMKTLPFFLVVLLPVLVVATTNIFVSPFGSDQSGDGSSGNPYQTIQKAVDEATTGDTVMLLPGSYGGSVSLSKNLSFVAPAGYGSVVLQQSGGTIFAIDGGSSNFEALIFQSSKVGISTLFDGDYGSSVSVSNCGFFNCSTALYLDRYTNFSAVDSILDSCSYSFNFYELPIEVVFSNVSGKNSPHGMNYGSFGYADLTVYSSTFDSFPFYTGHTIIFDSTFTNCPFQTTGSSSLSDSTFSSSPITFLATKTAPTQANISMSLFESDAQSSALKGGGYTSFSVFSSAFSHFGTSAVQLNSGATMTAKNCSFVSNGDNTDDGGAIRVTSSSSFNGYACVFQDNTGKDGGALYCSSSTLSLQLCSFSGNHDDGKGGDAVVCDNCQYFEYDNSYDGMDSDPVKC